MTPHALAAILDDIEVAFSQLPAAMVTIWTTDRDEPALFYGPSHEVRLTFTTIDDGRLLVVSALGVATTYFACDHITVIEVSRPERQA